ncbi:signal peptide peptidase SppA [Rhizobium sp. L1K21]|uniref:signal peptide peptidase SppA n=1 Tax=Rhizobium sp. L1K21 TaxID=2954933 RepID=UPI0020935D41|nr:signal peptide peptidase SppA [Rhizobium sp. L1K21]MCO6187361.1 signal peptide peptidase SppA [Rhizobium sp. L1K21]
MDQNIADRRALRRKLSFWRVFAGVIAVVAIVGLWFAMTGGQSASSRDQIARVSISGIIQDNSELTGRFERIAKADNVKALIVEISSPGGTTYGGETIFKAIRKVADKKPVVTNIRTLAASAGYMVAAAGDEIVAGETSITGSIGVLFQYVQAQELMDKIGVSMEEIKSSPMKAEPSPFHAPPEEAKAMINAMIQDSYSWFVDLVAERRGMDRARALQLADGSVFSGRQAKENGLVDRLGGMDEIKDYLKTVKVDPDLPVMDWKAPSDGLSIGLPLALANQLGLGDAATLFDQAIVKKLFGDKLFLDGLVSVWQVGAD